MLLNDLFTARPTRTARLAILLACAWMMTACASSALPPDRPLIDASLRQPCPTLSPPADGQRATMLRWAVQTVGEPPPNRPTPP